ncbi:hypothetical protein DH2020_021245 [Rehmannia glutinosa]|uniref:C2H2-type domain-containing protein n=1 Tax=Rehmannia glutinosa TaxID=99300 RepID=A0ABR0WBA6_REHGL
MMSADGLPSVNNPSSIRGFIQDPNTNPSNPNPNPNLAKRKRNLPGTPDPDAEVIALSPNSLMATNRFLCEICNKGFQRDQNLQLHRRGHNLPWKLKQRSNKEIVRRKVYTCPEKTCVHHDPARALGDLTGVKKHYSRKHGEKKWKCEKCSKKYAVQSDWKAHSKICGTREYKCDCGTLFSRKDSFITHRAFCDALAQDSTRFTTPLPSTNLNFRNINVGLNNNNLQNAGSSSHFSSLFRPEIGGLILDSKNPHDLEKNRLPIWLDNNANLTVQMDAQNQWFNNRGQLVESFASGANINIPSSSSSSPLLLPRAVPKEEEENKTNNLSESISSLYYLNNHEITNPSMSATALLQKAAQMGSTRATVLRSSMRFRNRFLNQSRNEVAHDQNLEKGTGDQNILMMNNGLLMGDVTSAPTMTSSNNGDHGFLLSAENSLTRDFLGVGGNIELTKFASMEMSHYTGNNH